MKTIFLSAIFAAGACTAWAGLPLGRGEVNAQMTTSAIYDSNLFGTPLATGDYSGTVAPRISYRRQAGQIEADANVGVSFIRYLDQTQLDADNLAVDGALTFGESNLRNFSGYLRAAYVEASEVSTDLNARVDSKTTTLAGHTAVVAGTRTNVTLDGSYTNSDRSLGSNQQLLTTTAVYSYRDFFYGNSLRLSGEYDKTRTSGDNAISVPLNQDSTTFSAGLERAFADTALHARVSAGYRVLNRSAAETPSGDQRQAGSVFSASLDGPFLPAKYFPKITSQFSIAYEDAAAPGIYDTGTKELTGSLSLGWQARETTRISFVARRNQHLSINDLSVVTTSVALTLSQELRYNLTGSVSAAYDWSSYRGSARQDQIASVNAGLSYHFARSWDARLSYALTSTDSTIPTSTFDRHVVSVGLTHQF